MKNLLLLTFFLFLITLVTACGGGKSNTSSNDHTNSENINSQTGMPNDINGLVVFQVFEGGWGKRGVFILELSNGKIIKNKIISKTGTNPYAYDRNTIAYVHPCGDSHGTKYVQTISERGLSSQPLTPCTDEVMDNYIYAPIASTKISPDKTKIFTEVLESVNGVNFVFIYNISTMKEINHYKATTNPEWHPDGRLLLTKEKRTGIYITDKNFTDNLIRIDQNKIHQPIDHIDVSPSGNNIIFAMAAQVWIMDLNGDNLYELIAENVDLQYPTWSPNEKYIVYMSYGLAHDHATSDRKITFFDLASKKKTVLETGDVLPKFLRPAGPMSWVK